MIQFLDVIESREQFRELMGEPSEKVTRKTLGKLDNHCQNFISRSPFIILTSADSSGNQDVSPKGDPAGFVMILDENTIAIPDRPGNRRADTFENILQNPNVGIIFLVPGKTETLRISGTAKIVRDEKLRTSMSIKGRLPDFALVIEVKEAFFHCSKCMIRSKLWKYEEWANLDGLPLLAETMVDAGKLDLSVEEMHQIVLNDENERLY
ncbi:pyridoxamine 5'-phosphate oxidase [Colwellia sp. PAMC 20917]|uniref:MSMEG_1061 family FMN-dependent PPOX-type flavoprotein n=1 Tax=Colwellia sp. PAMC 20917 TaxID=1816218 RepID=UPI000879119A|nr:MSMEG_1061 family FMN-dependent PPOX-type flavoprotein [Colwellia sp. PAMC 20917]AOW78625.1 pyridoxamine 5'-phosphate oxidase [Colwellia sp. PAMC 20917]